MKGERDIFSDLRNLFYTSEEAFIIYNHLKSLKSKDSNVSLIITRNYNSAKECFDYLAGDYLSGKINESKLTLEQGNRIVTIMPIDKVTKCTTSKKYLNITFVD